MPDTNALLVLSATSSLLISGLIDGSYVGGLYVARSSRLPFVKTSHQYHGERARRPTERWRDDDDVIRARLKAALLSTCASCGVVYACVSLGYAGSVSELMYHIGGLTRLKKA
jgi:prenyl protein peptidase